MSITWAEVSCMPNRVLLCDQKLSGVPEKSEMIEKELTSLRQEIQILGQTFCAKWCGNIYIVSCNTLFTLFVATFIVSLLLVLFIIARQASTAILWILLYVIAIQPTTLIRGLVRFSLLTLINYWPNVQISDFWHYNTLTKNIDHGSSDTNICLLIISFSVFFLLIFRSCKWRYRKMLTSCGSFLV